MPQGRMPDATGEDAGCHGAGCRMPRGRVPPRANRAPTLVRVSMGGRGGELWRSQGGALSQQAAAAQLLQCSRNRLHRGSLRRAEPCPRHAAGLEGLGQPRLEHHLLVRCRWRAKRWPCARAAVARHRPQYGTPGERRCTACACACACHLPLLQQTALPLTEASTTSSSAQTSDWCTGTRAHGLVTRLVAAHPAPGWSKAVTPAAVGRRYSTGVPLLRHPSGEALLLGQLIALSKRVGLWSAAWAALRVRTP